MGREIIQNSMIDSLETILGLVANINSKKGVIPQIDIDLLKQHIRKLYQDVHYLDEENQKWKNEPPKVRDEKIMQREENVPMREESEPTVVDQNNKEILTDQEKEIEIPAAEEKVEPVEEIPEEEIQEKVPEVQEEPEEIHEEPVDETQEEEKPEIEEIKAEVPIEKEPALFDEPISLADKFSKEEKSINEKLSEENTNKAVHQNAQSTPVSNLKTAIGINDKFMFVNELFQGDMKSYDAFIREVNDMNNGAAALNAYSQKLKSLGADNESAAAVKLGEYIERRFL